MNQFCKLLIAVSLIANCTLSALGQENSSRDSFVSPDFREIQKRINNASRELSIATNEDERTEANEKLQKALGDDYDARIAEYENHLAQAAKRLDEMRGKLKRRKDAKQDMIRLRLQVLESEAEELGWPPRLHGQIGLMKSEPGEFRSYTTQARPTRRSDSSNKPNQSTNGLDPSAEYFRLINHDKSRDQALIRLSGLHKNRVQWGAEVHRLESSGADPAEIEKAKNALAKTIDRMTALEKKFQIGELDPNEVVMARNRLNVLQNKENELLRYKGRQSEGVYQTGK